MGDALTHSGQYDRVVMNPPFEDGQDIDHVRRAFDANLKPGGKLVAIMSEGPFFRSDKKAQAFRQWLEENGGTSERLAPGTFKESGTGTATRLVTVEKGRVAKGTPNGSLESPGLDAASPAPGVVLPPRAHRDPFPFAGYMDFRGLPVHLENLRGSVRQGVDPNGKPWSVTMAHHYGEIESTEGADGDPLDVYVGPDVGSDVVVVVRQVDPDTRAFDEHKAMLGFASVNAALRAYRDQYTRPGFYGGHATMTLGAFPEWIAKNANKAEAPTDEPTLGNLTAALL